MISNNRHIRQQFDTRTHILMLFLLLLMMTLFARLLYLQWYQHENLLLQSNNNRINVVPVLPTRGLILDRDGIPLASNKISYRIHLIPEHCEDIHALLVDLQNKLLWSDKKLNYIERQVKRSRRDRPMLIDDQLTWMQVAPIAARIHHYPGLDLLSSTHRYYPYKELTSHLIGYLSLARDNDLKNGYRHTEYVGRTGLERELENELHGITGSQQEEVNARGQRVSILHTVPASIGDNINTTIDIGLQQTIWDQLGDETGAVVVMDVHSGEVIALVSKPGFNSNLFITGLGQEQWDDWRFNPQKPLMNRAIQATYPPASTLKVITSLAGLKHHSPLIHQSTYCNGFIELNDRKLRCWNKRGHGQVNLEQSLSQSCDVFYYKLGEELGMPALVDEMKNWGLGTFTHIGLTPESDGNIPTPLQILSNGRTRPWYQGNIMITAIGQGSTTVTPLQIARFAAAIANGGDILKPQLILHQQSEILWHADVQPEHLREVQHAMRSVVTQRHGTAHRVLEGAKWDIAGKTGTAQVVAMERDKSKQDTVVERHLKDHAWFMGYAPFDHPQIAFAILVEHGEHGSSSAAPIAKTIVDYLADKESAQ
ncbi:MAG: penicillin-binding protein 2 [Zetaproteobacteria bacterium]|nr:penicillin-binding protein 2 [Zetaproteobacteria bacterium]